MTFSLSLNRIRGLFGPDIQFFFVILIIALLPLSIKLCNIPIILLTLSWLFEGGFYDKWENIKRHPIALACLLFFIINLFGLTYSEDLKTGFSILERRALFLVFPLVIGSNNFFSPSRARSLFYVFSVTLSLYCLICYINAVFNSGVLYPNYNPDQFYYSFPFSRREYTQVIGGIHPGYLSMYLLLAVSFLISEIFNPSRTVQIKIIHLVLLSFISFNLIILSSKIHLAILPVILILTVFYYTRRLKNGIFFLVIRFIITILLAVLVINDGQMQYRLKNEINKSFQDKYEQWDTAFEVFKSNPVIGVGTGDNKVEMNKIYIQKNYLDNYHKNAHNQFLDTLVRFGIVGASILIYIYAKSFVLAFNKKSLMYFNFCLIVIFGSLTETILETYKGFVFFTLFILLFPTIKPLKSL